MIRRIIKYFYSPFLSPSFRYSRKFMGFQGIFTYFAPETMMQVAIDMIARVYELEGDYLEFGVYVGRSFTSAFHLAQSRNLKSMRFYAFDSFEGLPNITGKDKNDSCPYSKGQYSCDVKQFKKNLSANGIDLNKVSIIPGWFDDVLNKETKKKLPIKKAALIWVDCDLYESTVPVLNFITDYVQDGTIIVFDDWFSFKGNLNMGEQRAFREWLKKNPSIRATEFHRFATGNSFFIENDY